ncbi:ABC transporter H family member 4-like [Myripristis murdjan]|uniref:ABC transporter H family member 4-like n=1 Tax=Myripristis murdjan TaxID=586833 RepID=UPI001175EA32|nr:ABC transporter H family member 4-like [Myripristis murdjan]
MAQQLRWLRTNTLCLVIFSISGSLYGQSVPECGNSFLSQKSGSPAETKAYFLAMEITNRAFTPALHNPASEEYQAMYKDVNDLLNVIYNCHDICICPTYVFYGGVAAMTFKPGSVIANATVVFHTTSINHFIVLAIFLENIKNYTPQTLELNLDYTKKSPPVRDQGFKVVVTTPATTTTTTTTATTTIDPTTTTVPTTTTTTRAAHNYYNDNNHNHNTHYYHNYNAHNYNHHNYIHNHNTHDYHNHNTHDNHHNHNTHD